MDRPKTLQQAIRYFSNEDVCAATVAALRWPDGPSCELLHHHGWSAGTAFCELPPLRRSVLS